MALRPIEFKRPFDFSLSVAAAGNVTVKGLLVREYAATLAAANEPWPTTFVGFKDYPGTEYVSVVQKLLAVCHAGVPTRRAMHEVATNQYPALRNSMLGKVIFSMIGNDVPSLVKLSSKGYALASTTGPLEVLKCTENMARARLTRQIMPIEGWHTGVWSGALATANARVKRMEVDLEDEFNGILEVEW